MLLCFEGFGLKVGKFRLFGSTERRKNGRIAREAEAVYRAESEEFALKWHNETADSAKVPEMVSEVGELRRESTVPKYSSSLPYLPSLHCSDRHLSGTGVLRVAGA